MTSDIYPTITIARNVHPNRWYAIPVIGFISKLIIVIPVAIEVLCLNIAVFVMLCIGPFVILFTKRYWLPEYELYLGLMRLQTKVSFFLYGLTDTYPGFSLESKTFALVIPIPQKPTIAFAIPLLGFLARIILLIPFSMYTSVIKLAGILAFFVSWIAVLFGGVYPEPTYEIIRDGIRLSLASTSYLAGLSDNYPSFWISMNHKGIKITLIVIAAILFLLNQFSSFTHHKSTQYKYQYEYPASTGNTY